ncbi:MAG: hypothetical protein K6C97_10825 [Treponema sp.]|nr:hypothetical protein [Treponema sp.]
MKKIIFIGAFLITVFSFAACSSTKEVSDVSTDVNEGVEKSADESKDSLNDDNNNKKAKKDKSIDWQESSSKEVTYKNGIIRIIVKPKLGTYNIAVENQDDKYIPVFSTGNEYTTTSIALKVNRKRYSLMAAPNVKSSVTKNDNGVTINYKVNQTADVDLIMDCLKSVPDHDLDMLKCTIRVKNIGKKKAEFTVKHIIDSILGEKTNYHFYTSESIPVKNEVMCRNLDDQKWFVSKNNSAAVQFLFNGGDTSAPDIFALANYTTLDTSSWEPDMTTYRSFDTVLSYNNSAVGVIWPAVKLLPDQSADFVYYLAFATDGEKPCGDIYVYGLTPPEAVETQSVEEVVEEVQEKTLEEDFTPKNHENVEFTVKKLSSEKYTPEYIQSLLDRIAELEKDSASVNREELLKLNQELDEILEALKE